MTKHVILGAGPVAHAIVGALSSRGQDLPPSPPPRESVLAPSVKTARLNVMPRLRRNRAAA